MRVLFGQGSRATLKVSGLVLVQSCTLEKAFLPAPYEVMLIRWRGQRAIGFVHDHSAVQISIDVRRTHGPNGIVQKGQPRPSVDCRRY